ncbi:MAG: hypothetical protein ACI9U2_004318 [Bradymonadia bacterium]|jgi:hypothetical protein
MRAVLTFLTLSIGVAPAGAWAAPATGTVLIQGAPSGSPVSIDGKSIGETPLPGPWTLTAGLHEVKIGARTQQVTVAAGGQAKVAYAVGPAAPTKAETAALQAATRFPVVTAGYVGAGAGVLVVGAGLFFGLSDADGVSKQEANAVFANIGYGIGGVLLAGGVAMIIWGDDGASSSVGIAPTLGGAVIGGSF